jgi:ribosomal protein L20
LKASGIDLDRKVLADLAVNEPDAFAELAGQVKRTLSNGQQQAAA